MDKYLVILIDSLLKKTKYLDEIGENLQKQEQALASKEFSLETVGELMEQKSEIIEKMNQLDDGFTSLYERVAPELKRDPTDYTDKVRQMQDLITEISSKIALIQAREMRIHAAVEKTINTLRPSEARTVNRAEVAARYYKTMKKATTPTSVFINKKN